MKPELTLRHEFVEYIPDVLEDGTIYISIAFATASHRCCCGCGKEIVTPLSPTDWKLIFDGESISLDPSIGNWSLPCQSHYWIRQNRVRWAERWTSDQIQAGRKYDAVAKKAHYDTKRSDSRSDKAGQPSNDHREDGRTKKPGFWSRLRNFWS